MRAFSLQTKLVTLTTGLVAITVGVGVWLSVRREAGIVRDQTEVTMQRIAGFIRRASARSRRFGTLQDLLDRLREAPNRRDEQGQMRRGVRPDIAFIVLHDLQTGDAEFAINPEVRRLWDSIPDADLDAKGRIEAAERLLSSGVIGEDRLRIVEVERRARRDGAVVAKIRVGYSLADLKQRVLRMQAQRVGIGLVIFVLGAVGSALMARHLIRPVRQLALAAARVANGNLDVDVSPTTHDELRDLTLTFNRMVRGLRRQRRLWEGLRLAGEYQARLLPQDAPRPPGFDIAAKYVPSQRVSGDFYDYVPLDEDRLLLIVGDVSGKGMPAALLVAGLLGVLRSEAANGHALPHIVRSMNTFVCRHTSESTFVSLFAGVLDARDRALTYCNAGHEPPLLIRGDGSEPELVEGSDTLLGLFEETSFSVDQVDLRPDDVLLIYTDGVTDREVDTEGRRLSRAGLLELGQELHQENASCIADQIYERVAALMDRRSRQDDFTLVVIRARQSSERGPVPPDAASGQRRD